jgi:hypothetical protein
LTEAGDAVEAGRPDHALDINPELGEFKIQADRRDHECGFEQVEIGIMVGELDHVITPELGELACSPDAVGPRFPDRVVGFSSKILGDEFVDEFDLPFLSAPKPVTGRNFDAVGARKNAAPPRRMPPKT